MIIINNNQYKQNINLYIYQLRKINDGILPKAINKVFSYFIHLLPDRLLFFFTVTSRISLVFEGRWIYLERSLFSQYLDQKSFWSFCIWPYIHNVNKWRILIPGQHIYYGMMPFLTWAFKLIWNIIHWR